MAKATALMIAVLRGASLPGGGAAGCSFYTPRLPMDRCIEWSGLPDAPHGRFPADGLADVRAAGGAGAALKTDDEPAGSSWAFTSTSSIFGIGVYTDTPGSPSFDDQLDTALDLVGRGGWVTIFLCSWRTHTTSCVNRSTTHDPTSSAMLQAAYDRGLNVVARIGNPYTIRDHADDSTRSSLRQLGSAYARLVASLPAPPPGSRPLYVQVGNELNACNEWHCSDPPNVTMTGEEMAMEVAAFTRDVAISLIPLRNGSVRSTTDADSSVPSGGGGLL